MGTLIGLTNAYVFRPAFTRIGAMNESLSKLKAKEIRCKEKGMLGAAGVISIQVKELKHRIEVQIAQTAKRKIYKQKLHNLERGID